MATTVHGHDQRDPSPDSTDKGWLLAVAESAALDAGAPAELLGEYLTFLADAAISGRRPSERELTGIGALGRQAAEQGVAADRAVHLYLSAAWRLWHEIPAVVRSRDRDKVSAAAEAVLRVLDDAVAVLVNAHQSARRVMIRQEISERRDFIDDLLRGDTDVSRIVERAEPFGLDLGLPHQVALASTDSELTAIDTVAMQLERLVVDYFGDRDVLVASKDGQLVVLVPSANLIDRPDAMADDIGRFVCDALEKLRSNHTWRIATGRPYSGAYGVCRSYEEARDALTLAERLHLNAGVVQARDLLVYRVLGRDQAAMVDLIQSVLGPLTHARGGAEPLLKTLQTYFATGGVATETARQLHMSVRTVTYRLAKVKALTGHDPTNPAEKFGLHAALLGALLFQWPAQPLPDIG